MQKDNYNDETNLRTLIETHISHHIGKFDLILHPRESAELHIDICVVPPSAERNFYTLVTNGMSQLPLYNETDAGLQEVYLELMLALPADWPLTAEGILDANNFWPIEWLQRLAIYPHLNDIFLGLGDSIPNGDPAEPLAANTELCGFIIGLPTLVDKEFVFLQTDAAEVTFLALLPVYADELLFKLEEGAEAFLDAAEDAGLTELIDTKRAPIVSQI